MCLFVNEIWWLVFHYIILICAMIVSWYKTFQFYFFIFSLSDPYYIMTCCYKQNEINVIVDKYLSCCITLINETFLISLFKKTVWRVGWGCQNNKILQWKLYCYTKIIKKEFPHLFTVGFVEIFFSLDSFCENFGSSHRFQCKINLIRFQNLDIILKRNPGKSYSIENVYKDWSWNYGNEAISLRSKIKMQYGSDTLN